MSLRVTASAETAVKAAQQKNENDNPGSTHDFPPPLRDGNSTYVVQPWCLTQARTGVA